MAHLLDLTSQGDVGTVTDDAQLASITLMDPQQLYELWERQPWSAHAIDFTRDKEQWAALAEEDKNHLAWNLSSFFVGEERVTTQFTGLVAAYESQSEEAFLTTQQSDEARHAPALQPLLRAGARPRRHLQGSPGARPRGRQPPLLRPLRRPPRPAPDRPL